MDSPRPWRSMMSQKLPRFTALKSGASLPAAKQNTPMGSSGPKRTSLAVTSFMGHGAPTMNRATLNRIWRSILSLKTIRLELNASNTRFRPCSINPLHGLLDQKTTLFFPPVNPGSRPRYPKVTFPLQTIHRRQFFFQDISTTGSPTPDHRPVACP